MGILGSGKHNSIRTTKQQLKSLQRHGMVLAGFISILTISAIVAFAFFFANRTQAYSDKVARTRIQNASSEVSKFIDSTMDEMENEMISFEAILEKEDIRTGSEIDEAKLKSAISSYSLNQNMEDVGVLYNDTILLQKDVSVANTVITDVSSDNLIKNGEYIYIYIPADTTLEGISGIVGRVKTESVAKMIESPMYGEKNSIILADDEGDIILVSSKNYSGAFDSNVFDYMNMNQAEGFQNHLTAYKANESYVAEDKVAGEKQMIYHMVLNHKASDTSYHFLFVVPKSELTSQITKYSSASMGVLYTAILIGTMIVIMLIHTALRFYKEDKENKAYDKIGLLNHETFLHDVSAVLCTSSGSYGILCMNICDFSRINTIYGTDRADKLLKHVADVIKDLLTDEGELSGHSRGDKFMLLIKGNQDDVIYKIGVIENTLLNNEDVMEYNPSFHFGIKMTNSSMATEVRKEYECAVFAQKKIENNAKDHFLFFDDQMLKKQADDNDLIERFDDAIKNEEFEVYLQLKWDLRKNTWGGAEALVRWRTPDKGLISPGKFIPLFEANGFITKLDKYMFEHVCMLVSSMLDNGEECVKVSLNLSRRNFTDLAFIPVFRDIISKYKTPHELIEFEITEGLLMDNAENYQSFIKEVHENGYSVSMDDFGAGFSSLNMINELKFDTIKLDARFFRSGFDEANQTIVANIIDLCHKLGKTVVAEGVENANEVEFLRQHGCDLIQGYYFAKPQPFEEFKKLLQK